MAPLRGEVVAVAAGLGYLGLLSWSMTNLSYDIWGALIVIPVYAALGLVGLRRMFRDDLGAVTAVMCWGLLIKLGGALARYWVGFEAYGGSIDAGRYHQFAIEEAGQVWSGERSVVDAIPTGTGTEFIDEFTAFVYTLTGGSKLAGFVTYSFLAFWGLAFIVKAAAIAVPGLALRKYALLCVVFPSIVYWPSSIGKEALMLLGLGVGTYGTAVLLAQRRWIRSLTILGLGLGFAALIRPHMTGIWLAAALPALVLAVLLGSRSLTSGGEHRRVGRFGLVTVLVLGAIGFVAIASATVEFLQPGNEESTSDAITQIFEETQRRTAQAGSNFQPPSIASPANWPYAAARTLTRPLPIEARGIAQLISAAELVALGLVWALSWKRVTSLPRMLVTNPYVLFAMTALFLSGLAFSSFANLGVLTRQKSLLFPFLLLVPCLPLNGGRRPASVDQATARRATNALDRPASAVSAGSLEARRRDADRSELDAFWA